MLVVLAPQLLLLLTLVVLLQIKRYKFYKDRISPTHMEEEFSVKVPLEISPLT